MAGRNLVVLCDGTSNEVEGDLTNVLKLYRIAAKTEEQFVFYHPGVGTIGLVSEWGRLGQGLQSVLGLATGWGLDRNILQAYRFLSEHWREGDCVFLFGFSRGAYTVRALAGLIHMIGLLRPEQLNLCDYALTAYKRASSEDDLGIVWRFARVIGARPIAIDFLGVWDTVASVLLPRRDRFFIPSMSFLPYTKQNPSVRVFRHAAAIDERRRMFRLYGWKDGQSFMPSSGNAQFQDAKTVWFAGVHADIGGGYPEAESQPAKYPLIWMVEEARQFGLAIDDALFRHLASGDPLASGTKNYVAPDPLAPLHESMRGPWSLLEWLPKNLKWRRYLGKTPRRGWYLPRAEPRMIEDDGLLHESVIARESSTDYRPINLPRPK